MTLETEVQELIRASNEQTAASQSLAQEVAGKMAEINARTAKLDQDVSNIIQSKMIEVYYVAPNGSDQNDGTKSNPLATIDKALKLSVDGSVVGIYLQSAAVESPHNVYDISASYDLSSRNVVIGSYDGNLCTLRFMDGSSLTTRSGGSIRFADRSNITLEIVESRTTDHLVSSYGGDVSFGGYYGVALKNASPSLKMICKTGYHAGNYAMGVSVVHCHFSRLTTDGSIETDFVLGDVYLGGMLTMSLYGCVLTGNIAIHNPSRPVQQISSGSGYILTA